MVVILYYVDLQDVKSALLRADYRLVIPVLVLYTLGLMTRAKAWNTILLDEASYGIVFLTLNAGYLLNNILPLRLGELGRAFLLGRRGFGFWRVFSTILVERAFDFIIVVGMLMSTLPFVWGAPEAYKVALIVVSIVILGLVVLHLMAYNQDKVLNYYEILGSRWPRLTRLGKDRLTAFISGLVALTDLRRFLGVLFWMVMSWIFSVLAHYLLLLALLPSAKFLWTVFGLSVAALGVALPSSPAYVGILEAAWVSALSLFGVTLSTAFAFAVASHLLNIVVTSVFGVYALVREGESLMLLYYRIRKESS